jgi:hypothetical protein
LYGIHVAGGNIDLNKTLAELGIDDTPPLTDSEKRARIVDLLQSRSGVYHSAAYETPSMKKKRPQRGSHPPGTFFWYNNWDFNTLCSILEQETGAKIFEEYQKRFATALQMEDFRLQDTYYHLEKRHSIHPAYPFRMSARDMARFGLLFLRRGNWRGKQIIPQHWVDQSTASHFRESDTTPNPQYAYGYLWWRIVDGPLKELGMYSARGYGGHSIDVLPGASLVFVHRVDTFWDLSRHFNREKKRVKDAERFKLLDMILRARVSQPKTNPKMTALRKSTERPDVRALESSILDRYVGEYEFEKFKLYVKRRDGKLLIGNPGMGEFDLLALSETRFLVGDVRIPVSFELGSGGNPTRITVESESGQQCYGRPVRPQDRP